jgi:hypothetical protein
MLANFVIVMANVHIDKRNELRISYVWVFPVSYAVGSKDRTHNLAIYM